MGCGRLKGDGVGVGWWVIEGRWGGSGRLKGDGVGVVGWAIEGRWSGSGSGRVGE